MKVLVVGAGLIGVTTAYFLNRQGYDVTVVDGEEGAGRQTTFANGGLLTSSMPHPWNGPGSWRVLMSSVARSDAALQLRLRALPSLTGWGISFLRNSRPECFKRNTLSNLRLSVHSLKVLGAIRRECSIDYGHATRGSLKIFRDPTALERATAATAWLTPEGLIFRSLSVEQTVELEPGLAPIGDQLAGALHCASDEVGDAYRFCTGLAEQARNCGVEFRFRTSVRSLDVRNNLIRGVVTEEGRLIADRYIVAAGSYSTPLLERIGIHLPVRPAKGYSVTFTQRSGTEILGIPVIDDQLHAAITPLEGAIRVAGTAEFASFDRTLNPIRVRNLLALLQSVLPQTHFEPAMAKAWCGLRPMSADGVPIIGPTAIANLLVNCGHGHLGWTMAAGSARLLTDLVSGNVPAIDPAPYSLERFLC